MAAQESSQVNYGASNYEGTNYWTVTDNDPNGLAQEAELERLQEIREKRNSGELNMAVNVGVDLEDQASGASNSNVNQRSR